MAPRNRTHHCERTGKRRFRDHAAAVAALRRIGKGRPGDRTPVRCYECDACDGWHLTAQPVWGKDPMSFELTTADIVALGDVLRDLAEHSDTLDPEEAVAFLDACAGVQTALKDAVGLLQAQVKTTLESPRMINGRVYTVRDDGKWRPDHAGVRAAVISAAAGAASVHRDIEGAIAAACQHTYNLMMDLFVSPSTLPKVEALKRLGLTKKEVARWEKTGTKIEVVDLHGPQEDGG